MAGGQPWRGHDYKTGIMLSGDGPGLTLRTNWTPDIRSTLTYVMIGARLDPIAGPGRDERLGGRGEPRGGPLQGLHDQADLHATRATSGGNCGTNNLGTYAYGGYQPNQCNTSHRLVPPGDSPLRSRGLRSTTSRYTIGGDLRWTVGGFSLQPTLYYQWGHGPVATGGPSIP